MSFVERLHQAAREELEGGAGVIELGPPPHGPCDAVTFLPDRTLVAADVDETWLAEHLPTRDGGAPETRSAELGRFVTGMVERLGGPPATIGVLTAAVPRAAMLRGEFTEAGAPERAWAAYRSGVRTRRFTDHGLAGTIDLGRGPGERWDTLVRPDRPGSGDARQLLAAALTLIPRSAVLFGSAPVHDVDAMRTMFGGGFRPIGLEVLFLTRPGEAGEQRPPGSGASSSRGSEQKAPGRLARLFGGGRSAR
jgi:hypothetical protein